MRIMQINAVSGILSTGHITKELALSLQQRGHETSVVYSEGVLDYSEGYHMDNRVDKKIHAFFSRITGLVGYFSRRETKKLLAYISEWKPDVVHLHNLHSNYIHIPMLYKYLGENKIPTVITLHDCFPFTGKCCHYTITECYKWQQQCGHCPRIRMDNRSWFFDRTKKMLLDKKAYYGNIDKLAVVGVSKWVMEQATQSVFPKTAYTSYIYNGIDCVKFQYTSNSLRTRMGINNKFIVLGVANVWDETKGLADFISLAKELRDVAFVLIGNMQRRCLPQNIISIPRTDCVEELVEYYSMADVFANLSVEETFGKVTAEALACGTPAIVYNTTACPELIGEGCGFVVELHDLEGVKDKIREIMYQGKGYYQERCRDFALCNFEREKSVQQYLDVYEEIQLSEGL